MSTANTNDMPNLNNLEKWLSDKSRKASPKKASPKKASPQKASPQKASPQKASPQKASPQRAYSRKAPASPGMSNLLGGTPGKGWNYINEALAGGINLKDILGESPARDGGDFNWMPLEPTKGRKIAPKARKIAPKARKIAPSPARPASVAESQSRLSSPDRQFAHKFDGMDTGEKDDKGRVIYAGRRGGKFVISSSGARVPYLQNKLQTRLDKGKYPFTGKVDRNGLKVFKGPRGGLFVIDNKSGKKKNPLHPLRDA
ncbi:PBCV-specific basic adaptor domain-containing protein [Acanthocystis turfacea Chlorella virus Canal-1]|nr:PBCV-specific basic adaptor domain-containing protein [Acanthocystis turfacea Chlorella virus Canal-1]